VHLLLLAVDAVGQLLRRVLFRVEIQVLQHALDHRLLVLVVVDGEVLLDADGVGVAPQEPRADGVEGAHPHAAHAARHQLLEARAHLAGRLVGEGHREDARREHVLVHDQVRHAVRDDARLAAARAREDHQRALGVEHGLALRRVHALEVDHCASLRS
jgi:hypothetical protein